MHAELRGGLRAGTKFMVDGEPRTLLFPVPFDFAALMKKADDPLSIEMSVELYEWSGRHEYDMGVAIYLYRGRC